MGERGEGIAPWSGFGPSDLGREAGGSGGQGQESLGLLRWAG